MSANWQIVCPRRRKGTSASSYVCAVKTMQVAFNRLRYCAIKNVLLKMFEVVKQKKKSFRFAGLYGLLGLSEVEVLRISRQSAHEALRTCRLYPPSQRIFLVLNYVRGRVDLSAIVRTEGVGQ